MKYRRYLRVTVILITVVAMMGYIGSNDYQDASNLEKIMKARIDQTPTKRKWM